MLGDTLICHIAKRHRAIDPADAFKYRLKC